MQYEVWNKCQIHCDAWLSREDCCTSVEQGEYWSPNITFHNAEPQSDQKS